jgi:hypothetical protein
MMKSFSKNDEDGIFEMKTKILTISAKRLFLKASLSAIDEDRRKKYSTSLHKLFCE